ncbi:glutamate 5-kinase [Aliiglaciecola lipolytica]|uniref:Glutamate 5-kinase n=1 Tax=Aliiglaciecola lipolytica E3 TaxID=1127673 RepID=K6YI29_9ALTE|nr:glutamate 5-kinase [Aliiglaciecola lipolytica]GAC16273.1 glutamate 5-kinase [Aliiglaciecola lipolytica E3]
MHQFEWQRAVIKVGSALIAPDGQQCSARYLLAIARFITASKEQGKEVILVSSGSVAAGRSSVPIHHPPSIAEKQAMASIGQMQMMANWSRFFDFPCAQLLLTYDDLHSRTRYVNIKNTLRELLNHQALPIVNENDTVAVNELKVGDNDNLAAYTALIAQADTLIICSDVDGLYDQDPRKNPHANLIPEVTCVDESIFALAGGAGTKLGTGGMHTKLQAAQKCTQSGIQTLIVNGQKGAVFDHLLEGKVLGTRFTPVASRENARRQWLKHTLKSGGKIVIDSGAKTAILSKGASLLPSGIVDVIGQFNSGDAVTIEYQNNALAKGLALYNSSDLNNIKGMRSCKIESILGYTFGEAVVHRDDMVLL